MNLKIYLIEDNKNRRGYINKYFKCVNLLLGGEKNEKMIEFPNCHQVFSDYGYTEVEIIEIIPRQKKDSPNCDFYFSESKGWVKKIDELLKTSDKESERRIFMVDLALNEEERIKFQSSEDEFIAYTARKTIDYIMTHSDRKEYVLIESFRQNVHNHFRTTLSINDVNYLSNVFLETLDGSLFVYGAAQDRVTVISNAFENILKEINDNETGLPKAKT